MDRPVVLLVSAMDSSGAAGMAQDVRAANALGHTVRCAVTALTVQDDSGVAAAWSTPARVLKGSIRSAWLGSQQPAAVKVGALVSGAVARAVAAGLGPVFGAGVPIVLDPVIRASSGGKLLDADGLRALVERLLPLCRLVTPNRGELAILAAALGEGSPSEDRRAEAILGSGAGSVLVTGGASRGASCIDRLYLPGQPSAAFCHPRVQGQEARGTGCCLSTAIACHLARGLGIKAACARSVSWTVARIRSSATVGAQRFLFP